MAFETLSTNKIARRCGDAVHRVLGSLYPGHEIRVDTNGNALDKKLAIDIVLMLPTGAEPITFQTKVRDSELLHNPNRQVQPPCPDFTQEYMNAFGTNWEEEGEWFHLHADYYLYAWEAQSKGELAEWLILDIPRYKQLVENKGGLDSIGIRRLNRTHGRALFYCIPVSRLAAAIEHSSSRFWES